MAQQSTTTNTTTTSSSSISTASTSDSTSSSTSSQSTASDPSSTTGSTTSTTTTTSSDTSSTNTGSTTSSTSSSTSSTTSSTSSSTTSLSSTSSSSQTFSTSTATLISTDPNGQTSTSTLTVITSSPANSTAASASSHTQPKGFFQNTGAVAGTFTAVGLIALVLLFVLVTAAIRRRRAKQFDREIAEAAAEAATAPVPVFLDDDDDNYGPGYGQTHNGYSNSPSGGYSDVSSHGTYGQPPMSHEGYPMSERSGPGPGNPYDPNSMYGIPAAAGAAGIGVARARSVRDGGGYAAALNEGNSPYPAFATSHPQYDMYNVPPQQPMYRGPGSHEGHEGINMAAVGGAAVAAGMHQAPPFYNGQSSGSNLSRMKSDGSRSFGDGYIPSVATSTTAHNSNVQQGESYASHYQPGFKDTAHQPANHPHNLQPGTKVEDDAYGGYTDYPDAGRTPSPAALPNPFAAKDDESGDESEEDHGGRRVLKVANN